MSSGDRAQRMGWWLVLGLAALYALGWLLGWGNYGSWHLLLVILAILFLYNVFQRRGR